MASGVYSGVQLGVRFARRLRRNVFAFNPGDLWQLWQSLLIRPIRVRIFCSIPAILAIPVFFPDRRLSALIYRRMLHPVLYSTPQKSILKKPKPGNTRVSLF
jgi:hypothetical protein